MSIYGSLPAPDDNHEHTCAVYVEVEPGVFELTGKACTCGLPGAPIVYRGSHVLPSASDERGGWVDLAAIAGHVTRGGRGDGPEDDDTPWPFLRFGVNASTVVLDRRGVELVHRSLGEWLKRTKDAPA